MRKGNSSNLQQILTTLLVDECVDAQPVPEVLQDGVAEELVAQPTVRLAEPDRLRVGAELHVGKGPAVSRRLKRAGEGEHGWKNFCLCLAMLLPN